MKQAIAEMKNADSRRTEEVEVLLTQLDSTVKALSATQEQIAKIPDMVTTVCASGLLPDLEASKMEGAIVEQLQVLFVELTKALWGRGIMPL